MEIGNRQPECQSGGGTIARRPTPQQLDRLWEAWNFDFVGRSRDELRDRGISIEVGILPNVARIVLPSRRHPGYGAAILLWVEEPWTARAPTELEEIDFALIGLASSAGHLARRIRREPLPRESIAAELERWASDLDRLADRVDAMNPRGDGASWRPIPEGAAFDAIAWTVRLGEGAHQ